MPQYPTIYLFLLGKGGNPYVSKPYIKTKVQVCFLSCPQHEKIQTKRGRCTSKLPKIGIFFPQILHLSSNRREQNLAFYFQLTTLARKLTRKIKFEHFWMQKRHEFQERHDSSALWPRETPKFSPRKTQILETPWFFGTLGQRNAKNQPQKDTNFRNAIILHYLGPENCQIQPQKT